MEFAIATKIATREITKSIWRNRLIVADLQRRIGWLKNYKPTELGGVTLARKQKERQE